MLCQEAFDQLILAGTGRAENEQVEAAGGHACAKFKGAEHPLLAKGLVQVFQGFRGIKG